MIEKWNVTDLFALASAVVFTSISLAVKPASRTKWGFVSTFGTTLALGPLLMMLCDPAATLAYQFHWIARDPEILAHVVNEARVVLVWSALISIIYICADLI